MTASHRKAYQVEEGEVEHFFRRTGQETILTAPAATFPPEHHYLIQIARNAWRAPRPEQPTWGGCVKAALRFHSSIRAELLNVIEEERRIKEICFRRVHTLCLEHQIVHPELSFKIRGKTAGDATGDKVRINLLLLHENAGEMLDDTVPHELCHTWNDQLKTRKKPHGPEWKALMGRMGFPKPSVTHCMDTSRASEKAPPVHAFTCECKANHRLSDRDRRELEAASRHDYEAICVRCHKPISFVGVDNAPNRAA